MSDFTVIRGDYGYYLQGTLTDSDDVVFDLTDYTVTIKAWQSGKHSSPIVSGTCEVVSATEGTWRYAVGTSDFITAGTYLVELEATKTGVKESSDTYTLEVKESP